jgi:hypothetical protein
MVVALIALFVAAGGPAYAVRQIDGKLLKDRSLAGGKLKNRSVSGTKLKPRTVPGNRLKPNAVTNVEVAESTFGRVPLATLADEATHAASADGATTATSASRAGNADKLTGLEVGQLVNGGSSFHASCDPPTTGPCRQVTISQPAMSNVFVIAVGEWFGESGAKATCSLHKGTSSASGLGTEVQLGQDLAAHTTEATGSGFALQYVFDDVPAGFPTFSLFCTEDSGTQDIQFANVKLSAFRLSGRNP